MSGFISDKMLGLFEEKIKSITRKADDEEEESSEQI